MQLQLLLHAFGGRQQGRIENSLTCVRLSPHALPLFRMPKHNKASSLLTLVDCQRRDLEDGPACLSGPAGWQRPLLRFAPSKKHIRCWSWFAR